MNIYAMPGTKIKFVHPEAGYPMDQRRAAGHLWYGNVYTVRKTRIDGYMTRVWLAEIPGDVSFNSAQFDDVTEGGDSHG